LGRRFYSLILRDTYKRLITKIVPSGIISIVSDTWDYWAVLTDIAPSLKEEIMARDGCVVFRPDSGDPVKIICGDPDAPEGTPAHKGSLQILWEEFGGTVNEEGYKQLDSHVGLIYGDSITLTRAYQILNSLEKAGFASSNIVFGIGSFTYQYVTRDTFGMAIKATYCTVDGQNRLLFKDPVTDNGAGKKSLKGLYQIEEVDGVITLIKDGLDFSEMSLIPFTKRNLAEEIPKQNFHEIRERTAANRQRILEGGWTPEKMFYAA
jgi:nicotinamide phosphoribosyltransferase